MATPDKSREDGERTGYSVRRFYDELSADYHLIFPDREASIARQGEILGALIEQRRGAAPQAVLDCSRGIGTQAIGLSAKGHRVIGSDLSPPAAARAAAEASSRDATLPVAAADIRALPFSPATFDVVVCADNSLHHLLTHWDICAALNEMRRPAADQHPRL